MTHNYTKKEILHAWNHRKYLPGQIQLEVNLRAFLAALPERPQPWPSQQEAIDKAFEFCGDDWLTTNSSSKLWLKEAPVRLAVAQAYDAARPQAAEIAGMKAELAEYVRRLQAAEHINEGYRAMEQKLEDAHSAVAELNQRLIERTQDMLSKQTELIQEARQAKREARDAQADLDIVKATLENTKETLRLQLLSFRKEEERATANLRRAERAEAELASLRTPILADDGRSLEQVAIQAHENTPAGMKWQAAAQAVVAAARPAIEAECLAQAVRLMEAVPLIELNRAWHQSDERGVRARLIAAVKGEGQAIKGLEGLTKERCLRIAEVEGDSTIAAGRPDVCPHAAPHVFCETCKASPCPIGIPAKREGQAKPAKLLGQHGPKGAPALCGPSANPVVVNEPPKNEEQPDLSGESEKQDPFEELKAAHAAGKEIEVECKFKGSGDWELLLKPNWNEVPARYRIKPESQPVVLNEPDLSGESEKQCKGCDGHGCTHVNGFKLDTCPICEGSGKAPQADEPAQAQQATAQPWTPAACLTPAKEGQQ